MKLKLLVEYCNKFLDAKSFQDYCPNGLQVEGSEDVSTIITGVTACEALIDEAINRNAQAIMVHHGYFWKGESQPITGLKGNRIKKLIKNDISLIAYHLPLDAHESVGNNAMLGDLLGIERKGSFYPVGSKDIALFGEIEKQSTKEYVGVLDKVLNRKSLWIKGNKQSIEKIAWCTGGAQSGFEQAIELGVDMYISGEVSENTYHLAKESGVHYVSAGHHATERYGVQALGNHLSKEFDLNIEFIDIDNPV